MRASQSDGITGSFLGVFGCRAGSSSLLLPKQTQGPTILPMQRSARNLNLTIHGSGMDNGKSEVYDFGRPVRHQPMRVN